MTAARMLPQSLDAETSVLGTCLADITGQAIEKALVLLKPEHFAHESHRLIFRAMASAYERGLPCEPLTIERELEREHTLGRLKKPQGDETAEEAGSSYLSDLACDYPVVSRVPHHCKLIIESWGKRLCIEAFTKPMRGAWNGSSPQQVLHQVEAACQSLHSLVVDSGDSQVVPALQAAEEAQRRVEDGVSSEGAVPPPFPFLDPLMPGRLYLLGGYAKDGKTDVGIQAAAAACAARIKTGFVSIEMARAYLVDRMIAQFGVPYGPLQNGIVAPNYQAAWRKALGEIGNWPLSIYDNPAADVSEIVRFQKLGHFDFLVIDHLHRISYEDARDPRLRLSANVKQLAILARSANIPILLLAQLHRSTTAGDGFPKPTMTSFKETSTIEQEASALWAIYRVREKTTGVRTPESKLMVLADRFGEDAVHDLHFEGQYQRFTPTDWRGL